MYRVPRKQDTPHYQTLTQFVNVLAFVDYLG